MGSVSLPLPLPSAALMAWHQPGPCLESSRVVLSRKLRFGSMSSQCSRSSGVKPIKILVSWFIIAFPCESPHGPGVPGVSRATFVCSRPWFVFLRSGNLSLGCVAARGRLCRGGIQLPFRWETEQGLNQQRVAAPPGAFLLGRSWCMFPNLD